MNDGVKGPTRAKRSLLLPVVAILGLCACAAGILLSRREALPNLPVWGPATQPYSSPVPESAQEVHLSLSAHILGTMLTLEGFSDLPNRTVLLYEVREASPHGRVEAGTVPVLDGQYSRLVDITGWGPGSIDVWVSFQTQLPGGEAQPPEVLERFGERGEFLHGENVADADGMPSVEAQASVPYLP